jgi:hypothetical protein
MKDNTINPITSRHTPMGGTQDMYRFPNGYGASVVRGPGTYGYESGLYELGVMKYAGPGDYDCKLTYDTPITSDVEGYLTPDAVQKLLSRIKKLPKVK